MTSAVLLLALSASGLGQHSVYASPQAPAKVIPTLQAPTKMPTIPSKVLPFPSKQAPQALPKVFAGSPGAAEGLSGPGCLPPGPGQGRSPGGPLKGYPAPAAFPQAPVKAAPQCAAEGLSGPGCLPQAPVKAAPQS